MKKKKAFVSFKLKAGQKTPKKHQQQNNSTHKTTTTTTATNCLKRVTDRGTPFFIRTMDKKQTNKKAFVSLKARVSLKAQTSKRPCGVQEKYGEESMSHSKPMYNASSRKQGKARV